MKLYKVLDRRRSCNGGDLLWKPGVWMPKIKGELVPYENGYNLCTIDQLIHWLGPQIWTAEGRGECIERRLKMVYRQARIVKKIEAWNIRSARLFACRRAEDVLSLYEKNHPDNPRPREAIRKARLFAYGKISKDEVAADWDAVDKVLWSFYSAITYATAGKKHIGWLKEIIEA